jgi:glycosyltransferase involved in cell wall biosynthesis
MSSGKNQGRVRVLLVVPALETGGAERMVVSLALGMDHDRFEVGLLSFWGRRAPALEALLDESPVKTWFLGKRPGFDPKVFVRLDEVIREFRPQVVHTHLRALRYSLPSCLLHRVPIKVHTLHSNVGTALEGTLEKLEFKAAALAGVITVALGAAIAEAMPKAYGFSPGAIIPNGVSLDRFARPASFERAELRKALGFGVDDFLFVSVGRLSEEKNHRLLIDAFSTLPKTNPSMLVLVGDGPLRPSLEAQIKSLSLDDRVLFLGNRDDVAQLLWVADGFVLSSDIEGVPLSLIEALGAGIPVIATQVGSVPEMIINKENGLLVQPGNRDDLAEAMETLMTQPELAMRLVSQALVVARARYDLPVMVAAYQQLYERGS